MNIVLASGLFLHYTVSVIVGLAVCGWGFLGSLVGGTFFLFLTMGVVGTGLIGPAVVVCCLLAGLGMFNIGWLFIILTATGVSCCLNASN